MNLSRTRSIFIIEVEFQQSSYKAKWRERGIGLLLTMKMTRTVLIYVTLSYLEFTSDDPLLLSHVSILLSTPCSVLQVVNNIIKFNSKYYWLILNFNYFGKLLLSLLILCASMEWWRLKIFFTQNNVCDWVWIFFLFQFEWRLFIFLHLIALTSIHNIMLNISRETIYLKWVNVQR